MPNYDLEKILPHKNPMILLDDIENVDIENNSLTSIFKIYPEKIFYEKNKGINSISGIEFMAQTIGCYSYFKNNCREPKPGLLLGTRLYNNNIDYFIENVTYKVKVAEVFSDNEIVVFDCLIYDDNNNEVVSASINVYQGENIEELLKGE